MVGYHFSEFDIMSLTSEILLTHLAGKALECYEKGRGLDEGDILRLRQVRNLLDKIGAGSTVAKYPLRGEEPLHFDDWNATLCCLALDTWKSQDGGAQINEEIFLRRLNRYHAALDAAIAQKPRIPRRGVLVLKDFLHAYGDTIDSHMDHTPPI